MVLDMRKFHCNWGRLEGRSTELRARFAALEAVGIFFLIELYIWRIRPVFSPFWIVILALIVISHAVRGENPGRLGFRLANFARAFGRCAPYVAGVVIVVIGLALAVRTVRAISLQWALLNLFAYCMWGLVQQYLLNGYFVNRFAKIGGNAAVLAAVCFSLAHLPNWLLMVLTLVGGYASARVYLAYRNLYVLGLAHGILGFAIYLAVPDTISRHLYVGPKWFGG